MSIFNRFLKVLSFKQSTSQTASVRGRRLVLESLEMREMLSVHPLLQNAAWDGGIVNYNPPIAASDVPGTNELGVPNQNPAKWLERLVPKSELSSDITNQWIVQLNQETLQTIDSVSSAAKLFEPYGITVIKGLGLEGMLLIRTDNIPKEQQNSILTSLSFLESWEHDANTSTVEDTENLIVGTPKVNTKWLERLVPKSELSSDITNQWIVQLNQETLQTIDSVSSAAKLFEPYGITVTRGLGLEGMLLIRTDNIPKEQQNSILASLSFLESWEHDANTSTERVSNNTAWLAVNAPPALGIPQVTVTQANGLVTLTWAAIPGADHYGVYRKVNGYWSAVNANVSGTAFTESSPLSGEQTYAVRAFNGTAYSNYIAVTV